MRGRRRRERQQRRRQGQQQLNRAAGGTARAQRGVTRSHGSPARTKPGNESARPLTVQTICRNPICFVRNAVCDNAIAKNSRSNAELQSFKLSRSDELMMLSTNSCLNFGGECPQRPFGCATAREREREREWDCGFDLDSPLLQEMCENVDDDRYELMWRAFSRLIGDASSKSKPMCLETVSILVEGKAAI